MAATTRVPYAQRGIRELRALARDRKIVGFSRMPKDVLVEVLRNGKAASGQTAAPRNGSSPAGTRSKSTAKPAAKASTRTKGASSTPAKSRRSTAKGARRR